MADCLFTIEGEGNMIIHILAGGPAEYCADFSSYENDFVTFCSIDLKDSSVFSLAELIEIYFLLLVV